MSTKEERAEYQREYRAANAARLAEYKRAAYLARRTEVLAAAKSAYGADPEAKRARSRAYRLANPDKVADGQRVYRATAATKIAEDKRRWKKTDAGRLASRRSVVARRNARGGYTLCTPASPAEIGALLAAAPGAHLDHVVPLARWGCSHPHNLQMIPAAENLRKSKSVPPAGTGCPLYWIPVVLSAEGAP